MPKRPAAVAQADIAHVFSTHEQAGADEVTVEGGGLIGIAAKAPGSATFDGRESRRLTQPISHARAGANDWRP